MEAVFRTRRVLSLPVGWALWSRGHPALAVIAWFVWPVMVGFSLMGIAGFFATSVSDALAKRSAAVTAATAAGTKASFPTILALSYTTSPRRIVVFGNPVT